MRLALTLSLTHAPFTCVAHFFGADRLDADGLVAHCSASFTSAQAPR